MTASRKKVTIVAVSLFVLILFIVGLSLVYQCQQKPCVIVYERYGQGLISTNQKYFNKYLDVFGTDGRDKTIAIYEDFWPDTGFPTYEKTSLRPIVVTITQQEISAGDGFPLLSTLDKSAMVATMTTKVKPLYVLINITLADHPPILEIGGQEYDNTQVAFSNALGLLLFDDRHGFFNLDTLDRNQVLNMLEL